MFEGTFSTDIYLNLIIYRMGKRRHSAKELVEALCEVLS